MCLELVSIQFWFVHVYRYEHLYVIGIRESRPPTLYVALCAMARPRAKYIPLCISPLT